MATRQSHRGNVHAPHLCRVHLAVIPLIDDDEAPELTPRALMGQLKTLLGSRGALKVLSHSLKRLRAIGRKGKATQDQFLAIVEEEIDTYLLKKSGKE
jgi:hypothetical protein